MAVITRYIVERNGEEKMTFVDKKEADAYDKELDIAENLQELLSSTELDIDESLLEDISLHIARNRDAIGLILKGSKPKKKSSDKKSKKANDDSLHAVDTNAEETPATEDNKVA